MTHEHECFAVLALGYLQGTLLESEKQVVHQLILTSPEFREILKSEIAFKKEFEALQRPLPDALKRRVYDNITVSQRQMVFQKVLQPVLAATLPGLMWPLLTLFQRSVLAND